MNVLKRLGVLSLLLIALVACSSQNSLDKVVMTYVSAPLNVPSIIEKDKSLFEQALKAEDIAFEYSNLTTGPEQTQALASGDVQILNCVGSTSLILAAANDADIKILTMYSRSSEPFALFSNDKNINSPQDLKGKKIVGPTGTVLHQLLVTYLAQEDMSIKDVEFVNMSIPDAMAALSNKNTDVALLAGPAAFNAQQADYHLITTAKGLLNSTLVVGVSQEFYDNNKVAVDAFLKTQAEILDFMENNYDETIKIVAKELDLDEKAVKEMYEQYDFDPTISEQDIKDMQETADFMYKNEMIEKEVNINNLIIK